MIKWWRGRRRGKLRSISFSLLGQGASFEFSQSEHERARAILLRLEDHRVLHAPYETEEEDGTWGSIEALRTYLNEQVDQCESAELRDEVRALRAAVRQWLTDAEAARKLAERLVPKERSYTEWDRVQWAFSLQALGVLRGRCGVAIAEICKTFGVPINGDLARVTPPDLNAAERDAALAPLYFDD